MVKSATVSLACRHLFEVAISTRSENSVLDALTPAGFAALSEHLETVQLTNRETIYEAGAEVTSVYFPIDCVISVVTSMNDGSAIETITVGREGIYPPQIALSAGKTSGRSFCHVPGRAYRMDAARFLERYAADENLRTVIGRYLVGLIDVLAQSAACNRLHLVTERSARWMLTTHDRVGSDKFPLTHEALAAMLGVRRAGVSIAAYALQEAGYISYRRGKFTILDAVGLASAACECYGVTRAIYDRWALQPA